MKILIFQYNRENSAIITESTLASEQPPGHSGLVTNRFLANGYADRLLWEEAASLRLKEPREYIIPGTWQ
ncbi:hypothetical protein [Desulfobulbus alkaliphilus]|uniref:hypothetical protein n=1 Tax=Desulfobulbus alkaliphilus TaxID=869814 RepID=UPI0019650AEA|nr:hypothetical protein [Desulfobulbus alkaliphilus]MBM9537398.1 hypothetical protein [Desulfobulbus alkaliphilus]